MIGIIIEIVILALIALIAIGIVLMAVELAV